MKIGDFITEADLAKLYGCQTRYIRGIAGKHGIPKKGPRGYPAWETIGAIIAHLRSNPATGDKKTQMAEEKLGKLREERLRLERERMVDDGELIPARLAIALVDEHFAAVRTEFENDYNLTIPSMCKGKTSGQIRKITDKLFADRCRNLQTRKSKCLPS